MKFFIVVEKMGSNYGAYSPDVDGCVATGESIEDTIENITQALQFHFEGFREDETIPASKGLSYWLSSGESLGGEKAIYTEVEIENTYSLAN